MVTNHCGMARNSADLMLATSFSGKKNYIHFLNVYIYIYIYCNACNFTILFLIITII